MFILSVVLALSLILLGIAGAASLVTMQKNGMELVQLRQATEMYGYSVEWDGKEKSITLTYTGMIMDDKMMNDKMMESLFTSRDPK